MSLGHVSLRKFGKKSLKGSESPRIEETARAAFLGDSQTRELGALSPPVPTSGSWQRALQSALWEGPRAASEGRLQPSTMPSLNSRCFSSANRCPTSPALEGVTHGTKAPEKEDVQAVFRHVSSEACVKQWHRDTPPPFPG